MRLSWVVASPSASLACFESAPSLLGRVIDAASQIAKGGDWEEKNEAIRGVWAGVGAGSPCRCTCIQRSSGDRAEQDGKDCPNDWIPSARMWSPVQRSGIHNSSAAFGTFQPSAEPPRLPGRPIMNTHPLYWLPPLGPLSATTRPLSTSARLHRPNPFESHAEARTRRQGMAICPR